MHTNLIVVTFLFSFIRVAHPQAWSWVGGENSANKLTTSKGPGARSGSSSWTDSKHNVWLFGGKGYSDVEAGSSRLLNDLWMYDSQKQNWTLVHSGTVSKTPSDKVAPSPRQLSAICGVTGITLVLYGGLDVKDKGLGDTWVYFIQKRKWLPLSKLDNHTAESSNKSVESPQGRGDMATWCMIDSMHVFGGMDNSKLIFNDMWKFEFKILKWAEVTFEKESDGGVPKGRNGPITWMVRGGELYMFGGNILRTNIRNRHLNMGYVSDMWRFYPANNTWEFLSGYKEGCKPAVFGRNMLYAPDIKYSAENHPGCRRRAASWIDTKGHLWMYGGDGTDMAYPSVFHSSKLLADLWYYNTTNRMWLWYGGSNVGNVEPDYGQGHGHGHGLTPGGRYEPAFWCGRHNKFYLFGGLGHDGHEHDGYLNDLWVLEMEDIVEPNGPPPALVITYVVLAVAIVLIMAGLYIYARDKQRTSVWGRLDPGIKYSQLTSVGD